MNFNKVLLGGRFTRDPETVQFENGSVTKFGLATNETYNDSSGNKQEKTTFVDCVIFGKRGEVIQKYFNKGDPIFLEGNLQLEEWTNKAGEKQNKLTVKVLNFEFIGSKKNESSEPVQQNRKEVKQSFNKPIAQKNYNVKKEIEEEMPF